MEQVATQSEPRKSESEQLLTFILNGEEYGVDILRVQEIRSWSAPMPLPNTVAYIKGVINIRGDIVPIADLRERMGMKPLEYGPTSVVVVVRAEDDAKQKVIGMIVDAMSDVTSVALDQIKRVPEVGDPDAQVIIRGIATCNEKMITILDVDQLFAGAAHGHRTSDPQ